MIEALVVTALPVAFFALLFATGARLRHRQIDMDGDPPIDRRLFYGSKYVIVVPWAATVLDSWGVLLSLVDAPPLLRTASTFVWVFGFAVILAGGLALGNSFRMGHARESTRLEANGLFRVSRNPMYLGVYCTLAASAMRTLNPVVLLVAGFIAAVHHRIVLSEEKHLRDAFGEPYLEYCRRVRRYL